jgi:hypothetical protein
MTEIVWVQLLSLSVCAIMSCRISSVMMDDWILLLKAVKYVVEDQLLRNKVWNQPFQVNERWVMCEFTQNWQNLYDGGKQLFEFTQHQAIQIKLKMPSVTSKVECVNSHRISWYQSKCKWDPWVVMGWWWLTKCGGRVEKIMTSRCPTVRWCIVGSKVCVVRVVLRYHTTIRGGISEDATEYVLLY